MKAKYDWEEIFGWLLELVRDLPYKASLRWAFYRSMDRFGLRKEDWVVFKDANARFRRAGRSGWRRDTLADSVRSVEYRGHGATTRTAWLQSVVDSASPVGIWDDLEVYVEAWFESEAMAGQFDHYLGEPYMITTRPFRGDYTIPMKEEAAQTLRWAVRSGKGATVLYFGDADKKGAQIPRSAVDDVKEWSGVEFGFRHGGLNPQQAAELGLPENPDRPGAWQWDALSDDQAREIISTVLAEEVDVARLADAVAAAGARQARWVSAARRALRLPSGAEAS